MNISKRCFCFLVTLLICCCSSSDKTDSPQKKSVAQQQKVQTVDKQTKTENAPVVAQNKDKSSSSHKNATSKKPQKKKQPQNVPTKKVAQKTTVKTPKTPKQKIKTIAKPPKKQKLFAIKNRTGHSIAVALWLLDGENSLRTSWFALASGYNYSIPRGWKIVALSGMIELSGNIWQSLFNMPPKGGSTFGVTWAYGRLPYDHFSVSREQRKMIYPNFPNHQQNLKDYLTQALKRFENENYTPKKQILPVIAFKPSGKNKSLAGKACILKATGHKSFPTITATIVKNP